ncbi:MAG TPA: hypothetical protein ENJ23_02685 [Bacteroidetes bacterium]|nr:hypothetical protein [Bacteroidota bacterium]
MKRTRIQNFLEYFAFRSVSAWLESLPIEKAIAMHEPLGRLWFNVLKIRRDVAEDNVRRAFPGISPEEVSEIVRRCFAHYSRVAIEQILLPKILLRYQDQFFAGANWEVLDQAQAEGRGVILVGGHLGNWELMGSLIAKRGYPVWAVATIQRNKMVDRLINRHRRISGLRIIPKGEARRKIPEVLRAGHFLGLVSDQDAGERGVFVPFFGIPASTPAGAAVYSLRYGTALVYIASYLADGKYRFHFERLPVENYSGLNEENIRRVTLLHVRKLEQDVRRFPEQYFWVHRRWKTPPPEQSGA